MEANDFVAKLKANGSESDLCDIDMVYKDFKNILSNVTAKNRGLFSLNVLCILCRNLEKVPSWKSVIDNKALLMLSIDCVRETRCLDKPNQVKALACIYNIHRHVIKLNTPIPPELVLKLSYMAFEGNIDLHEYFGTYWNILCNRILYIEKLKLERLAVNKLLTKLIEDVQKVIQMYNTYNFCVNTLVFLLKKLNFLYSDINSIELSKAFEKIFECLSTKNDIKLFKKLSQEELLDLYVKFLECLVVIAENESKVHFKNSVLTKITKTCITFLAHTSDVVHCLQRFFLTSFCNILTEKPDLLTTEMILKDILNAFMITEKMGYKKAVIATYPFVNQFLRLYIEYFVMNCEAKKWTENFTDEIQECCLKLILFLMKKLRDCKQFVKCENCKQNSGLHDALRISFQTKYFVSISLTQGVDITKVLPTIHSIVLRQHEILVELCALGCTNYDKCYKKLQADMHNTAVLLNKAQYYEYSIKLFDVYLQNEFKHFKGGTEMKNISRAMFNKSICELDYERHENALKSAYLSLIFALPESLKTDKHMSLVMDIKAKVLKWQTDNDIRNDGNQNENNQDDLQLMTVLNACLMSIDNDLYGNLKPFFCNLRFGELLKHEFDSYARLWPSVVPVAGVWRSLHALLRDKHLPWMKAKQEDTLERLYDIVMETPTTIRTIHSEYYSKIVADLLGDFEKTPPTSPDLKLIYATLLILKTEFDLHEASVKYEWQNTDSEQILSARTIPQEHNATKCAIKAVHVYMKLVKELDKVSKRALKNSLQIAQVAVPLLLHLCRNVEGLQMAAVCCKMAAAAEDKQALVRNAGTILYHASKHSDVLHELMKSSGQYTGQLIQNKETMETALVFMCDCAIYLTKCDALGLAAKLVQLAQARILQAYETDPDIKLELAVGRLLEAQTLACQETGPSALSAVNTLQRHYLGFSNSRSSWTNRRLYSLTLKLHISSSTLAACLTSRALMFWRRARTNATAGAAGSAGIRAKIQAAVVNPSNANDCQAKIDNRIKHILGLLPSNETQPYCQDTESKRGPFTPKQEIETMLKSLTLKKTQVSPSVTCLTVPGFKMPKFIEHTCTCQCYACQILTCQILACKVSGLEASLYFRSNEFEIARNYFDGALKCFGLVESKLERGITILRNEFDDYIVDIVETMYMRDFKRVELEFLIEASFFELSQTNYKNADENTLSINEILREDKKVDRYMTNEVMNLTIASAQLRKNDKKSEVFNFESELSPYKVVGPLKTPEHKAKKPPKLAKVIVKDEEVPNTKRRVIKLNFEDTNSEETEKPKTRSRRNVFKIPVPVTSKPVLETLTPKPTCRKILLTQPPSDIGSSIFEFAKPKADAEKSALFTLAPAKTPEQVFTPMKSMKKNLESSFAQLKSDKANDSNLLSTPMKVCETPKPKTNSKVDTGSIKSLRVKRSFKRATSPGKLETENKLTTNRCRNKPVRFNLEID